MDYGEIAKRLTPDAEALFVAMVDAHLASRKGDREFVLMQLGEGSYIYWTGDSTFSENTADESALRDLAGYGLLRVVRHGNDGAPTYDIPGDGLAFYRALREVRGQPITNVESAVRRLTEGAEFARTHSGVSDHLRMALELLWSDRVDDKTVSNLGSHLRSAIIDLVNTMAGATSEDVASSLKRALDSCAQEGRIQEREVVMLLELVRACQSLNKRLTHIRDETSKGRPLRNWDELRRATYLTTVLCSELGRF